MIHDLDRQLFQRLLTEPLFKSGFTIDLVVSMKKAHAFESAIVLLIVILACLLYIVVVPKPSHVGDWESSINGTPDYILPGSDGILYVFTGNNITAIDSKGKLSWKFNLSPGNDMWNGGPGDGIDAGYMIRHYQSSPQAVEQAGILYLLVRKPLDIDDARKACADNSKTTIDFPMGLMAISSQGEIKWERAINDSMPIAGFRSAVTEQDVKDRPAFLTYTGISSLTACDGRLYIFHDGQEDVLDTNGTLLYTLHSLSSMAVVDDRRYVYAVLAAPSTGDQQIQSSLNMGKFPSIHLRYSDYPNLTPSSTIAAFKPDGTKAWNIDIRESASPISTNTGEYTDNMSRLIYANHTLYVPVQKGVAAVSTDGLALWVRHLTDDWCTIFDTMPVDPAGNVYFQQFLDATYILTISPDGQVRSNARAFTWMGEAEPGSKTPVFIDGKDGIIFGTDGTTYMSPDQFNETYKSGHFYPGQVTAYDLANDRTLWTFTIPAEDTQAIPLTPDNYDEVANHGLGLFLLPNYAGAYTSITQHRIIEVHKGRNVTYVSYEYTIHEDPIVLNKSRGMYIRELYALDNHGRLLWKEPVGPIKQAAVSNDTIYYSTWEGQMGGGGSIAGGIAFFATLYLFIRFIAVGAVSRARNVLHINENRNDLIDHISNNPGSTAMEISRSLKMNLGTLRYHLLILSVNHKIVVHKDGDKYVRYFNNSGTYTAEERTLLSLMRREPIRRTLAMLVEKQGLSGTELSKELGVSDTAVYRHVNLLVERGIVTRELQGDRGFVYSIKAEHVQYLAGLIGSR